MSTTSAWRDARVQREWRIDGQGRLHLLDQVFNDVSPSTFCSYLQLPPGVSVAIENSRQMALSGEFGMVQIQVDGASDVTLCTEDRWVYTGLRDRLAGQQSSHRLGWGCHEIHVYIPAPSS